MAAQKMENTDSAKDLQEAQKMDLNKEPPKDLFFFQLD